MSILGFFRNAEVVKLQKRRELMERLRFQEARLEAATDRAAKAVRKSLDLGSIVRKYPFQSAFVFLVGGCLLAVKASEEFKRQGPIRPLPELPEPLPPEPLHDESAESVRVTVTTVELTVAP